MEVYFEKEDKTENVKLKGKTLLKDILKDYGISTESVILVKNDEICLEDSFVEDCDCVKILSVVSGG